MIQKTCSLFPNNCAKFRPERRNILQWNDVICTNIAKCAKSPRSAGFFCFATIRQTCHCERNCVQYITWSFDLYLFINQKMLLKSRLWELICAIWPEIVSADLQSPVRVLQAPYSEDCRLHAANKIWIKVKKSIFNCTSIVFTYLLVYMLCNILIKSIHNTLLHLLSFCGKLLGIGTTRVTTLARSMGILSKDGASCLNCQPPMLVRWMVSCFIPELWRGLKQSIYPRWVSLRYECRVREGSVEVK